MEAKKGLLGAYERLKPEDRIDIDLARIAEDRVDCLGW